MSICEGKETPIHMLAVYCGNGQVVIWDTHQRIRTELHAKEFVGTCPRPLGVGFTMGDPRMPKAQPAPAPAKTVPADG
jgi:hypothetical protein